MNKPMTALVLAVMLGTSLGGTLGHAACLSDGDVRAMDAAIAAKTPATNPGNFNEADGSCTRAKLNQLLAARYGAVIGYKAGLTNPLVQKRFAYHQPVWGILYQGMILDTGAVVDPAFGARPLYEADMLVRVKSDAVNSAKTPAEVLAAIDQMIPFIELPDLVVQAPLQLNGPGVAAINVGARLGVKGQPITVSDNEFTRTFLIDALREMTVRLTDGKDGTEIARGKGSDVLEHPLNAVVWLAGALRAEGLAMKPGDLISLGSFSPLTPPKPGQTVIASYDGLPGAQPVVVSFEPGRQPETAAATAP